MKKYFSIIVLLFVYTAVFSQSKLDSMENALKTKGRDTSRAVLLTGIAREYINKEPDKAMTLLKEALALSDSLGFKKGRARALATMGIIQKNQGDYDKALPNQLEALKLYEELGDKKGISSIYTNIGIIYKNQEKYTEALENHKLALKMNEELNDKHSISNSLHNMGICYRQLGDLEKALDCHNQSVKLKVEIGDKQGESNAYTSIGNIWKQKKDYTRAMEFYNKSQKIKKELGDKLGIANNALNIGSVYKEKKEYGKAIENLSEAIAIAKEVGSKELLKESYKDLSASYSGSGNIAKAFEYLQLYSDVKDSLYKESNSKTVAELQAIYESEKKEKEIELLKKDSEIQQSKQEEEIKRQNILRNSLIGVVILILIIGFLMYKRFREKQQSSHQLEIAFKQIEEKNKDITDSIRYAKRIQEAILPPARVVKKYVVDSFILYKPKDIVSGDFYWMDHKDNRTLFAAVDCTGHGVPGAFMSIVGHNIISQVVNDDNIAKPSDILNEVNEALTRTLRQKFDDTSVKDGMDIALCSIDFDKMEMEFSGAHNPLYVLRKNPEPLFTEAEMPSQEKYFTLYRDGFYLNEVKADRFPIGIFEGEKMRKFTNHKIKLQKNDTVYIFSDGYADQFGGPKGKKFKHVQFKNLILSMQNKGMEEQKAVLEKTLTYWMDGKEQVDDILVIGVRI